MDDKIGVTELNEIILNSMPNSWSKQAYIQEFDSEYISFNNLQTCLSVWKFPKVFMKVW